MAIKGISHVGVAVDDLAQAISALAIIFDHPPDKLESVTDQKIKAALFSAGQSQIELLAGTDDDSPISKYISKKGNGIHHLCLIVDNLEEELKRLKVAGIRLIDETPRQGVEGKLIAFIHPKSTAGILIELQQG